MSKLFFIFNTCIITLPDLFVSASAIIWVQYCELLCQTFQIYLLPSALLCFFIPPLSVFFPIISILLLFAINYKRYCLVEFKKRSSFEHNKLMSVQHNFVRSFTLPPSFVFQTFFFRNGQFFHLALLKDRYIEFMLPLKPVRQP